jgi:predicted Rossmann-fold nucleotide-binding protein
MRVIVCGGRDFDDQRTVHSALARLHEKHDLLVIIYGGAKGADRHAAGYAASAKKPCHLIHEGADWKTHGKAAGPLRNQAMIDRHAPEAVVAFPGGAGTADMVRRAEKAGLKVWFPCGRHDA